MTLHADEHPVTEDDVRRLVDRQAPRRPGTARDVAKEQAWLSHLAPHLPVEVPEPVFAGEPDEGYPFAWAVYHWIEGEEPSEATVTDCAEFAPGCRDGIAEVLAG